MARARGHSGRGFGLYLLVTRLLCPLAPTLLRHRLKKGKELPERWQEKLGKASVQRPDGPLIWMHAVGLGEALALRALIVALKSARPDLNILVTSGTRGSAEALAANGLSGALHQFLPIDCPRARRRFLDHWSPDLAVWSEQDIWPGLVHATAKRGIPQMWINARMNADAFTRRARMPRLYRATYGCFARIWAQDEQTAGFITDLGGVATIEGSLKPAAAPLADQPDERAEGHDQAQPFEQQGPVALLQAPADHRRLHARKQDQRANPGIERHVGVGKRHRIGKQRES